MPRFLARLKIPALLLLITIAFHWKLTLSGQYTCLESPDLVSQVMPWLQVQAAQWHSRHFPLWDPHHWAGLPLVGQVQPGTLNPVNWILFSMPLKDGLIQLYILHWYWVLIEFLGVLFCYWLGRDLGLSAAASALAGFAFGFAGFIGRIGWSQKMLSAVLLPLILMFFLRVLRGERPLSNAAISGAMMGGAFLSGHHNVPMLFALVMVGLWIYYFAGTRTRINWKATAPPAAFFACFVLIAAAQILPAFELGMLSLRWVGAPEALRWKDTVPYTVHENFSLSPASLVSIVIPGVTGEDALFVGLIVVTFALLGTAALWKDRTVRVLGAVGLSGLLLALGSNSVFHGILYAVIPGLDKIRSPNSAEAIFDLGIVVLAAYGLDSFRSGAHRLAIHLLGYFSLLLFATLVIMLIVQPDKYQQQHQSLGQTALVALLGSGVLFAWSRHWFQDHTGRLLTILLLLFELYPASTYGYHTFENAPMLRKLYEHRDLADFLREKQDFPRVEIDDKEIPYNFGDWLGIDQLGGNEPGIVKAVADVQGEIRYRMLLGANYYIGRTPSQPDQHVVFEGQQGLKVFANPAALARARIVHSAVAAADERAVIAAANNPATDLGRTVIVEGQAPQLETCEGGSAQIQRYRPSNVIVRADVPCRSMLIFADVWFPGWKALVDGKPAEIWKAYGIIRGIVLDRGPHEVKMIYQPWSVFIGVGLAVLGIALAVVLWLTGRGPEVRPTR